ncbi:MAG: hypothetical protein AAGK93_13575, partial [Pseudomonadota bacterium]
DHMECRIQALQQRVVEVLEYGIPYGQGHIFGAPRPIKSSLMQETAPPAELVRMLTTRAS